MACITGPLWENPPEADRLSSQRASDEEGFSCYDAAMTD